MRRLLTLYPNRTIFVAAFLIAALFPANFPADPGNAGNPEGKSPGRPARHSPQTQAPERRDLEAMRARVMRAWPLAMYYLRDDTFGLNSVVEHGPEMTVLAPQCYWLDENENIQGGVPAPVMEAARRVRLPVMALIYNRGFDRAIASGLLNNHGLQKRVIASMAAIARQDNLLGFQLDLENIDPREENLYTRFVREAAKELHRDGRLLSVAVVPRFAGSKFNQWSAAYDFAALAHASDFLTLMAYDNSGRNGPPGPIAGYDWVRDALDYALKRVPPEKLLLGIALYGREWSEDADGVQARTLPYAETAALLDRLSLQPRWDEKQRSPWFEYRTGKTVRRVWYEDARSIQEKLRLVERSQLRGFAAWRLGMEDPRIWPLVAAMREGRNAPPARNREVGF